MTKSEAREARNTGRAGAFVGMSPTTGRVPCDDFLVHGRRFHGLGQISFNKSGREGVHLDSNGMPYVTHLPNGTDLFLVIPVRQWHEN